MKALITELKHRLDLVQHRITAIAAEQTLLASEEEYLKKLLEQYEKQYYDTIVEERRITEAITMVSKQKDQLPNGTVPNAVEIFIKTCPENYFSYNELTKHINEYVGKKVSAGSIGPALKKMIKQGLINKTGYGKYTINK
jgi:hypothetical protein